MFKKKSKDGMSDLEKHAKMGVLQHLKDEAADHMGKNLHGLKKVAIMSDSKPGLEKGLATAQSLLHQGPAAGGSASHGVEDDSEGAYEKPEEGAMEEAGMGSEGFEDTNEHEMEPSHEDHEGMGENLEECSPEELDAKIKHLQMLKAKHQSKY